MMDWIQGKTSGIANTILQLGKPIYFLSSFLRLDRNYELNCSGNNLLLTHTELVVHCRFYGNENQLLELSDYSIE